MEQKKSLKALTQEQYTAKYITFKRRTDQDAVVRDVIIKALLLKYENKSIDMMSIGAGIGWLENCIIKHPCLKIRSMLAIEPNPDHLVKLREQSGKWTDTIVQIDSSYFNAHYETSQKFDIVLMVHSIYYMEDIFGAIMKAITSLKNGGQLIIVLQGDKGGTELAYHLHGKCPNALFAFGSTIWIPSDLMTNGLKKNGISFEVEHITILHDVTDFTTRRNIPDSSDTISFFLQTEYIDLDKHLQDEIYELVKERVTVTEDEKYMFHHQNSVIIVNSM